LIEHNDRRLRAAANELGQVFASRAGDDQKGLDRLQLALDRIVDPVDDSTAAKSRRRDPLLAEAGRIAIRQEFPLTRDDIYYPHPTR